MPTPACCNQASVWVENIRGKGYYYCRECKNEVVLQADKPTSPEPIEITKDIDPIELDNYDDYLFMIMDQEKPSFTAQYYGNHEWDYTTNTCKYCGLTVEECSQLGTSFCRHQ